MTVQCYSSREATRNVLLLVVGPLLLVSHTCFRLITSLPQGNRWTETITIIMRLVFLPSQLIKHTWPIIVHSSTEVLAINNGPSYLQRKGQRMLVFYNRHCSSYMYHSVQLSDRRIYYWEPVGRGQPNTMDKTAESILNQSVLCLEIEPYCFKHTQRS